MNRTEEIIYATTFAIAMAELRRQSLCSGVEFYELSRKHAATRAHKAVEQFRATFETLTEDFGESDPVTDTYRNFAGIDVEDAGSFSSGSSL